MYFDQSKDIIFAFRTITFGLFRNPGLGIYQGIAIIENKIYFYVDQSEQPILHN